MAQLDFDLTGVTPSTGATDPVPAGWYNAMVTESELKPNKGGDGSVLSLVFSVVDGYYMNRKIYVRLNVRNKSEVAQNIARADLAAIAKAVGYPTITDSAQVHNLPMKIKVKISKGNDGYEPSNDVTAYRSINEQVETVQQPQTAGAVTAPLAVPPAATAPFIPPVAPAFPQVGVPGMAPPAILGQAPQQAWNQPQQPPMQPPMDPNYGQPVIGQPPAFVAPVAPIAPQMPYEQPQAPVGYAPAQMPAQPVYQQPAQQPAPVYADPNLGQVAPQGYAPQQPMQPAYVDPNQGQPMQPAYAPQQPVAPVQQPVAPQQFDPTQPPAWMTTPAVAPQQ